MQIIHLADTAGNRFVRVQSWRVFCFVLCESPEGRLYIGEEAWPVGPARVVEPDPSRPVYVCAA